MNDQLISHIKAQIAHNKSHDNIVKELLTVGLKQEDIDVAFSTAQEAGQPVPATTISTTVTAGSSNLDATAENKLPDVFTLVKGGFAIYKARIGVLAGIGATQLGIFLLGSFFIYTSLVSMVIIGLGSTTAPPSFLLNNSTSIFIGIILLILVSILWVLRLTILASSQTIHRYKDSIGFVEAFTFSNTHRPLLALAVILGIGGVFISSVSLIPNTIFYFSKILLGFILSEWLVFPGMYIVGSLLIFVPLLIILFLFFRHISLTKSSRIFQTNSKLARNYLLQILWRMFGISFIISIVLALLILILVLILFFAQIVAGTIFLIAATVFLVSVALFFMPLLLATKHFLYEQIHGRNWSGPSRNVEMEMGGNGGNGVEMGSGPINLYK